MTLTLPETQIYRDLMLANHETPKYFLPVKLAGCDHLLPFVNVAPEGSDTPVWIAYFDPRISELAEAGAQELADRFVNLNSDVIVTPQSSKSVPMMLRARDLAAKRLNRNVELVIFERGFPDSPEMIEAEKNAIFSTKFTPITARGIEKLMTITATNLAVLNRYIHTGTVVIGDDVYSTGASIEAMNRLLRCAAGFPDIGNNELDFPAVTVMRECEVGVDNQLEISNINNLYPAIITPVIIGNL